MDVVLPVSAQSKKWAAYPKEGLFFLIQHLAKAYIYVNEFAYTLSSFSVNFVKNIKVIGKEMPSLYFCLVC